MQKKKYHQVAAYFEKQNLSIPIRITDFDELLTSKWVAIHGQ
jgi:hypothetical protein